MIRRKRKAKRNLPRRGPGGRFVKRNAARRKPARRKPARRKPVRKSMKRNAPKRKASKRKAPKRKAMKRNKRRAPKRSYKRRGMKRNKRRRRPMKRNADVKPLLVKAGVGFLGYLGGRMLAHQLAVQPVIPSVVRPYASVLGPAGMAVLAYYGLGQKGPKALKKMRKYQLPLVIGAGVAALDALFTQFAPPSLQALIGGAAAPVPAPAMEGWQGTSSHWGDGGSSGYRSMLPGASYPVAAGMNEYIQEPMGEYVTDGMGEYVMTDSDGVPMGDLHNLDAGVIDDGLYGDPGDDALDIEVLD